MLLILHNNEVWFQIFIKFLINKKFEFVDYSYKELITSTFVIDNNFDNLTFWGTNISKTNLAKFNTVLYSHINQNDYSYLFKTEVHR